MAGQISFTAHVEDEGTASADKPLTFTINPHVAITTLSLPDVDVNESYNQQLQASGGTPSLSWTDKYDELTAFGLSLATTGLISGTATPAGMVSFTAQVADQVGDETEQQYSFEVLAAYVCGDADASGAANITDAVYLIGFIFAEGPAPDPLLSGDANCDTFVSISDAVYLIQYIFAGGPAPCAECK